MLARVLLAVLLLVTWRTEVHAVHNVTQCNEICSNGEQCNLANSISCNTNQGITLSGGADLDFKGKTITCNACPANANGVLVTGSNSTIEDNGDANGNRGGVIGAWTVGVNCQLNTGSIAKNLHVDGSGTGLGGCRKVQSASVVNSTTYGITNTSLGGTDYIKTSFVAHAPTGIKLGGSGSALVDHNVIANNSTYGIDASATTSSGLTISGNTLFTEGGGVIIYRNTATPTTTANVCGAQGETVCGNCISAGDCEAPETPFVGP